MRIRVEIGENGRPMSRMTIGILGSCTTNKASLAPNPRYGCIGERSRGCSGCGSNTRRAPLGVEDKLAACRWLRFTHASRFLNDVNLGKL